MILCFNVDMKVSFCADKIANNEHLMKMRYIKIPDLSDEQISNTNKTKVLPDNYYYFYAKHTASRSSTWEEKVSKGTPKPYSNYIKGYICTNTIPANAVVENYKNNTYLKKKDISIGHEKNRAANLTMFITGAFAVILTALKLKK